MNKERNLAIDMFRGLTVALMVCVNDFWAVLNVPHYLEHFGATEDGMGLSDIVYPLFLFAMGMSVPYALERRIEKGFSTLDTLRHIFSRTLALLVMGVFIVNAETFGVSWNTGIYWFVMVLGFFLVWNKYPRDWKPAKGLQWAGIAVLVGLALAYRSPDGDLFRAGWWGILGQIGWMYLFCAIAYLLCRERKWLLWVLWGAFCLINLSVVPMRGGETLIGRNVVADFSNALNLGNGHSVIMALGGILTTLTHKQLKTGKVQFALGAVVLLAAFGYLTHQFWIISKPIGTLPWCLYCSAIAVALYTLLSLLEKRGWVGWFKPLRPAGTSTLTVYMLPYLFNCLWFLFPLSVPAWLTGWLGVGKCALFSLLCIAITYGLEKIGIKLKI